MRTALAFIALTSLLGCSVPVSETLPPPSTPRGAALAAFAAYDARDWARLAGVVHPDAMAGFRDRMIEIARLVAAAQREEAGRPAASPEKGDEPSVGWLQRIPADSLFIREVRKRFAYLQDRPELEPHVTREILGEVADGDSAVYVVYRVTTRVGAYKQMKAQEGKEVELLAVRRVPGGWRPWLNNGLMAPRTAGLDLIRAVQ